MTAKKQTVLVTGGVGYIGSVLCNDLFTEGYDVRIFDNQYFPRYRISEQFPAATSIRGDIRTVLDHLFDHVDHVIHLAALSNDPTSEFNPPLTMEINRTATKLLADTAKKHGVRRFIFASSCSIYDKGSGVPKLMDETSAVSPTKPYPLSKYLAEQDILPLSDDRFCVTALRKGTVFGFSPRMRYDLLINTMVRDAISHGEIHIYCGGNQWRPLISVEHVSAVYRSMLTLPARIIGGQIFNIADGNLLVKDVAKKIRSIFAHQFNRNISIRYDQNNRVDRSYRVSTHKAETSIGFVPDEDMDGAIADLIRYVMEHPEYQDFGNTIYYNTLQLEKRLA